MLSVCLDNAKKLFAEMFSGVLILVSLVTIVTKLFISFYIFNKNNEEI